MIGSQNEGLRPQVVVLLLEDNPVSRFVIREVLERAGCTCLEAEDAEEAASLLAERGADLLLTDVSLAAENGFEVAQRLRRLSPRMPVLFMSGFSLEQLAQRGLLRPEQLGSGYAEFLQKPFLPRTLLDRLFALLQCHRTLP